MHIALGYHWFPTALGYHWERALRAGGHQVSYVGLPAPERAGYDQRVPLPALLAQLRPAPDLYVWIDPAGPYFPRGIEDLELPTACYLVDVHLGRWRETAACFFDHVFVSQPGYVARFQQAVGHAAVTWLPFAAALDRHPPAERARDLDIGFVGNLAVAHRRTARARRLKLLAERFRTNDFYRPYSPATLAEVYNRARIVFNTSTAGEITMRLFEGAGCGALLLTDPADGLEQLFDVGREVVVYSDDADLLAKARHYLEHEAERQAIAAAGRRRTHAEHQYVHRMAQFIAAVRETPPRAPMRAAAAAERRAARRVVYTHLHMLDALLDEARAADQAPLARLWAAAPILLRRLVR
ncbi:MAG: glycosyltransferase [Anaerolineales bacterium]|nr:glycosyltransferase [Anaerolineales bacterium]